MKIYKSVIRKYSNNPSNMKFVRATKAVYESLSL